MKKLSKSEFMHLAINDLYKRKRADKEKLQGAEIYSIENINRINKRRRK